MADRSLHIARNGEKLGRVAVSEITGDTASYQGYHVATMANGDTTAVKYQGSAKMKDGKPVSGEGTWIYTSGTGKMKGIKGKGTYKGKAVIQVEEA